MTAKRWKCLLLSLRWVSSASSVYSLFSLYCFLMNRLSPPASYHLSSCQSERLFERTWDFEGCHCLGWIEFWFIPSFFPLTLNIWFFCIDVQVIDNYLHSFSLCRPFVFLPLHEILPSLPQHGADPTKKNRDGNTPLDLVKDGDTDIQDLLRGDAALLDAAKKGCLARVQKLCSPDNINCRDTQGRNSTPLHLAGKRQE